MGDEELHWWRERGRRLGKLLFKGVVQPVLNDDNQVAAWEIVQDLDEPVVVGG